LNKILSETKRKRRNYELIMINNISESVIDKELLRWGRKNYIVYDDRGRRRKGKGKPQHLTVRELAKKIFRVYKQVERYENEDCMQLPPLDVLKQICCVLQIDANELLGLRWKDLRSMKERDRLE